MKFEKIKIGIWHIILLVISTIYIILNRKFIGNLSEYNAQNLIFLIWLLLLMLPLFSEIELPGIKLKKEIDQVKDELSNKIQEVRIDMMNLKISNSNSSHFYMGREYLPSEDKINNLIEDSKRKTDGPKTDVVDEKSPKTKFEDTGTPKVSEESVYLFRVRAYIERNLVQIVSKFGFERIHNMREMVTFILTRELISGKTADMLLEVIKISSRGIHGEIVSPQYIEFIHTMMPEIEKVFEELHNRIELYSCPKCKQTSYSAYQNQCSICGFISDDY